MGADAVDSITELIGVIRSGGLVVGIIVGVVGVAYMARLYRDWFGTGDRRRQITEPQIRAVKSVADDLKGFIHENRDDHKELVRAMKAVAAQQEKTAEAMTKMADVVSRATDKMHDLERGAERVYGALSRPA